MTKLFTNLLIKIKVAFYILSPSLIVAIHLVFKNGKMGEGT